MQAAWRRSKGMKEAVKWNQGEGCLGAFIEIDKSFNIGDSWTNSGSMREVKRNKSFPNEAAA